MNAPPRRTASLPVLPACQPKTSGSVSVSPTVSLEDDRRFLAATTADKEAAYIKRNRENRVAGLFIHNPTDKPLPLSVNRSIPLPRFWKKSGPPKAAPDILRRTGSTSALFSREEERQSQSQSGAQHSTWLCNGCNTENSALAERCVICVTTRQENNRRRRPRGVSEEERQPGHTLRRNVPLRSRSVDCDVTEPFAGWHHSSPSSSSTAGASATAGSRRGGTRNGQQKQKQLQQQLSISEHGPYTHTTTMKRSAPTNKLTRSQSSDSGDVQFASTRRNSDFVGIARTGTNWGGEPEDPDPYASYSSCDTFKHGMLSFLRPKLGRRRASMGL